MVELSEEDRRVCYGILNNHHSGKPFQLLKEVTFMDDSDQVRIVIDPSMVEIGNYFSDRYGDADGRILHKVFVHELFVRHNEAVNRMNPEEREMN